MPIYYALHKNEKIAGKERYIARVHSIGTLSCEEMIKRMCQAGTTFTESDMIGLWYLMRATALNAMLDGWNVTTPFGILWVSARGLYKSYDDRFDSQRHKFVLQLKIDSEFQKELERGVRPKKIEAHDRRPLLISYRDAYTKQHDRVLTPSHMGQLYGQRLQFDPQDPRQGIYVLSADSSVTRVEEVAVNQPSSLIFLIPPLPNGHYKLAVLTTCRGQELTAGILEDILRVAPPDLLLEEPAGPFPSSAVQLLEMGGTVEDPPAATKGGEDSASVPDL